jgi:Insertion element 4 transposase N-terminal
MVYYVLALALFAGVAYEEVLRCLVEGLRGAAWWPNPREPWRVRLGAAPMRVLFEQAARPLATDQTQGAWYRGLRLVLGLIQVTTDQFRRSRRRGGSLA